MGTRLIGLLLIAIGVAVASGALPLSVVPVGEPKYVRVLRVELSGTSPPWALTVEYEVLRPIEGGRLLIIGQGAGGSSVILRSVPLSVGRASAVLVDHPLYYAEGLALAVSRGEEYPEVVEVVRVPVAGIERYERWREEVLGGARWRYEARRRGFVAVLDVWRYDEARAVYVDVVVDGTYRWYDVCEACVAIGSRVKKCVGLGRSLAEVYLTPEEWEEVRRVGLGVVPVEYQFGPLVASAIKVPYADMKPYSPSEVPYRPMPQPVPTPPGLPEEPPVVEGFFTINGIRVESPEQRIVVETETVTVRFTAVSNGHAVGAVQVVVRRPSGTVIYSVRLSEVEPSRVWEGTLGLPERGVYEVEGYVLVRGARSAALSVYGLARSREAAALSSAQLALAAVPVLLGLFLLARGRRW